MDLRMEAIIKAFLRYSFKDAGYRYDNLTPNEKRICTEKEFNALVKWLNEQ